MKRQSEGKYEFNGQVINLKVDLNGSLFVQNKGNFTGIGTFIIQNLLTETNNEGKSDSIELEWSNVLKSY